MKKPTQRNAAAGRCHAGRFAFFGGDPDWASPCNRSMERTHVITDYAVANAPVIELCEHHYQQTLAAGLVADPNPSDETMAAAKRFRPEIFGSP